MARKEIRIAGFGGQGIVLAGSIIGKAASIFDGKFAVLTQSYGPESRGGSCRAEVVISEAPVDYPYVVNPHVLVILSQEAYSEYGNSGHEDVLTVIDEDLVIADSSVKPQPLSLPASRMAQDLGRPIVVNIIVLGFLAAKSDIVSSEALRKAVLDSIPAGTEDLNMKAFDLGYKYGTEYTSKKH
jgi:2-oxoglutarate ferredoxin oxidoreductase subunit gamma